MSCRQDSTSPADGGAALQGAAQRATLLDAHLSSGDDDDEYEGSVASEPAPGAGSREAPCTGAPFASPLACTSQTPLDNMRQYVVDCDFTHDGRMHLGTYDCAKDAIRPALCCNQMHQDVSECARNDTPWAGAKAHAPNTSRTLVHSLTVRACA